MDGEKKRGGVEQARAALRGAAFEALYGPFAWAYDWVSRTFFLGQWRVWQRASLRFVKGRRVLEVGMGTGNLQLDLVRVGFEVWGVDLSPQMLGMTMRKARRRGVEVRVCRARAQALPFPDSQFGTVVSTFPNEYIIDPRTLGEIKRVLRPGGRFVVVPGGWLKPRGARGQVMEAVARVVYGYRGGRGKLDVPEMEGEVSEGEGSYRWVAAMKGRLEEAGFGVSAHRVSNEVGTCLVVVGE